METLYLEDQDFMVSSFSKICKLDFYLDIQLYFKLDF